MSNLGPIKSGMSLIFFFVKQDRSPTLCSTINCFQPLLHVCSMCIRLSVFKMNRNKNLTLASKKKFQIHLTKVSKCSRASDFWRLTWIYAVFKTFFLTLLWWGGTHIYFGRKGTKKKTLRQVVSHFMWIWQFKLFSCLIVASFIIWIFFPEPGI